MDINSLREKAEDNDVEAQALLSLALLTGEGAEPDDTEGWKWFWKASENPETLESIVTPVAVSSHPELCKRLFDFYKTDKKKANLFLIPLAESGDAEAEHALGAACRYGRLVPASYRGDAIAEYWLLRAVQHGELAAHRDLYELYSSTEIIELQSKEKAFSHLEKIVHAGRISDTYNLGKLVFEGIGTNKDEVEGIKWLYLSACRLEEGPAWLYLLDIYQKIPASVFNEGKNKAHEWIRETADTSKPSNIYNELIDPITGEKLDVASIGIVQEPDTFFEVVFEEKRRAWHAYCQNENEHDASEFNQLLVEDPKLTGVQLQDLFKHYNVRDNLIHRFTTACDSRFERSYKKVSTHVLEQAARNDLLTKHSLVEQASDFPEFEGSFNKKRITDAAVEIVSDYQEFLVAESSEDNPEVLLSQLLDERVSELVRSQSVVGYYGLKEALYGVLADYSLVYFVLSAFLNDGIDFDDYVLIHGARAQYALVSDSLKIYVNSK